MLPCSKQASMKLVFIEQFMLDSLAKGKMFKQWIKLKAIKSKIVNSYKFLNFN